MVTGVYPLAQAVQSIGQVDVSVIDLSMPGHDPATLSPTAAQARQVRSAGLVVEMGGGYQPALSRAAAGNPHVVTLLPVLGGTDPAVWLDPAEMERAVPLIGGALIRADPAAAGDFRNGERDFAQILQSLDIDFMRSLSDCAARAVATPDGAFRPVAARYGFIDDVVTGSAEANPSAIGRDAAGIRAAGATTALTEPYADNAALRAAAEAAHVRIRSIDTLAGPPARGWPAGANYFALMEQDLSVLQGALQCASSQQ